MFLRLMLVAVLLMAVGRVDAAVDAYDVRGLGDRGRLVYLVPGLASPGRVWDGLAAVLVEEGYRVRVLTLAGFAGQPSLPGDEFLPEVRRQLAAELARHEGPRPLIVGHSLGAFLAYWLAVTEPGHLAGVVAIDGLPYLAALGNPEATPEGQRAQARPVGPLHGRLDG